MASPRDSSLPRVCLTCGDEGDAKLLIYCRKCRDSAVHHYCMDNVSPDDDNINWWCWDCAPSKPDPLRKSKRISSKKQKVIETRSYWREKLWQNKRLIKVSNGFSEGTGQSIIAVQLPKEDMQTQLSNGRPRDILEEEKAITEIPSHLIDEPTAATKGTLPLHEENDMKSFDEARKIQEVGKNRRILVLNDSSDSQDEGQTFDHQLSALVANDHCLKSDALPEPPSLEPDDCLSAEPVCAQDEGQTFDHQLSALVANDHCPKSDALPEPPSLEPDDCLSAEPVCDPIWRGWFDIKEESETCIGILAHLSNKACSKVSNAATTIPPILDIQVLDKRVVWPKSFRASPPTAASIALYFFPACERDERAFDSLLDDVIERDLALKAMIDNVELLIFSSCELTLEQWRYKFKYFLWGVFRQTQRSHSSAAAATSTHRNSTTEHSELSQPVIVVNNKKLAHSEYADHLSSLGQTNQSPMSRTSSQASNVLASKQNTPESLSSPSLWIIRLENTVEQQNFEGKNQARNGDSRREEEKIGCFVATENSYNSCELRMRFDIDNASAAEVVLA